MKYLLSAAVAAILAGGVAQAADVAAGEASFARNCRSCHAIVSTDGTEIVKGGKTGPNLYDIVGHVAGSNEEFGERRYSKQLVEAGKAGLTWDAASLDAWLTDPTAFLKEKTGDARARSKMVYKVASESDRADLIAYMQSISD